MAGYGSDFYGVGEYGTAGVPVPPGPSIPTTRVITTTPSPRFLTEVMDSHVLSVSVEVLRNGEVIEVLEPVSGSVTLDAKAEIRGSFELTVVGNPNDPVVPTVSTDPLTPFGNEIRISRGIRYRDGNEELVQLGVFRIDEVEVNDTGDNVEVRVTGQDRAAKVSDAKFEQPYDAIHFGTLFTDAILTIVETAIGEVEFDFVDTAVTTPGLQAEEGDDPWTLATGLAQAIGAELYFNNAGVLVLAPVPQPSEQPKFEYREGEVLLEVSKTWTRIDAFNRVIVTAENSDINPPIRAEASDTDPDSPTFYGGTFGKVPRFYSNEYITDQLQAADVAAGILKAELGITHQLNFGAITNPAVKANDVIYLRRDRLGLTEIHVIDSITIPLDAETSMSGTTRLVHKAAISVSVDDPRDHLYLSSELILGSDKLLY